MKVYYDFKTKKWYQYEINHSLHFGKSCQFILNKGSISTAMLPFQSTIDSNRVGPLIGILVGESKNKRGFKGNVKKLAKIQLLLAEKGHICVVFTPSSIQSTKINGFVYVPEYNDWLKVTIPLPDIVYNRIPFRSMEKKKVYNEALEFLNKQKIPFFNPHFFSKKQVYELLAKNPSIRKYLPATTDYTNNHDILSMLKKHPILYVKSSSGHKGKGIYKINTINDPPTVQTIKETYPFSTLVEMIPFFNQVFLQEEFIIQEAITPDEYLGNRYDLRVLAHYTQDGYQISGIGVRVSSYHDITTHVPNGGRIIPYTEIRERIDEAVLHELIYNVGNTLQSGLKQLIGEFSVDLCKTKDGKYYLFEVNSKPMEFDEENIEESGIDYLTELLIMWGRLSMVGKLEKQE